MMLVFHSSSKLGGQPNCRAEPGHRQDFPVIKTPFCSRDPLICTNPMNAEIQKAYRVYPTPVS